MQLELDFEGKEVRAGRSPYFLTRREAARELEVTKNTISSYITELYLLDAVKVHNMWRLPLSSVQYFKDNKKQLLHIKECHTNWIKSQERGVI